MGKHEFLKGANALGEALIRAGCRFYCGYPITPSSELLEYMSQAMPKAGGVFVQVESENIAINMLEGAAATGRRAATASSGPGMSLMQEGISYICGAELPCVLIDVCRDGPALGGISSSQADYFQATRGGGHGGYRTIVLAPSTVQEMVGLVSPAFELAEKYLNPVVIFADALLAQAYEVVDLPSPVAEVPSAPPWALTGASNRPRNLIPEYFSGEKLNLKLMEKYRSISENERSFELVSNQMKDLLIVAFGTTARVCRSVVREASQEGIGVGLFRPISLYPFPYDELREAAVDVKEILVVEMSPGEMIDDVRIALGDRKNIKFYGRVGGVVPTRKEILSYVREIINSKKGVNDG